MKLEPVESKKDIKLGDAHARWSDHGRSEEELERLGARRLERAGPVPPPPPIITRAGLVLPSSFTGRTGHHTQPLDSRLFDLGDGAHHHPVPHILIRP